LTYRPVYLDTSALVKLVLHEPESRALADWIGEWPDRLSSVVSAVELHRALRRITAPPAMTRRMSELMTSLSLVRLDPPVLELAGALPGRSLRFLDAIHLATALSIGDAPEAFVTYDVRLAQAAKRARLNVVAPA
jgi:predicted nucleic acid-binding protein